MQFERFIQRVEVPEEVEKILMTLDSQYSSRVSSSTWRELYQKMAPIISDEDFRALLNDFAEPDRQHIIYLYVELKLAQVAHAEYRQRGISDKIYFETMKFFGRELREGFQRTGEFTFVGKVWGIRHIQLRQFRLGTFEYERLYDGTINLHIPSNASLRSNDRQSSYRLAKEFFMKFFNTPSELICMTWLLSPALKKLLPSSSHILEFQQDFNIVEWRKDSVGYRKWLFNDTVSPVDQLPENTMLQRNAKSFLLNGGRIGVALGHLRKF